MLVTACEKENVLEDITLNNPYDLEVVDYVEVYNVKQLGCATIEIDLRIKPSNIPPSLDYTHFIIKPSDKFARKVPISTTENIKLAVPCNQEEKFFITLYENDTELESLPSVYIYTP